MPDPNARLLAELRHPADGGPAADHLAESGADLACVLRLFADGILSREGLAEFCPQAGEVADGKARRQAVLAEWFPEAEVLAENVLAQMDGHPCYEVELRQALRSQVPAALIGDTDAVFAVVLDEVQPARAAFRRRVLRLFPEVRNGVRYPLPLRRFGVIHNHEDSRSILDYLRRTSAAPAGRPVVFSPVLTDLLRDNGFDVRLGFRWRVNDDLACVEFRQDQPAEYLVTPQPPEDWQVGDAVDCRPIGGLAHCVRGRGQDFADPVGLVVRRRHGDRLLVRVACGDVWAVSGIRPPR